MGSVVSTSRVRMVCSGPRGEGGRHGEDGSRTVFHAPERGRLGNRRLMLAGLVGACALLALVVFAGRCLAGAAVASDFAAKNLAPCAAHPFGTDWMGRDMLARTLAGLSTSVFVGLLAAACSGVIAFALACVAALGGSVADAAVSWLVDLVMGIPHIVLLILVSYALGRGAVGVTVGVALTHWPSLARVPCCRRCFRSCSWVSF